MDPQKVALKQDGLIKEAAHDFFTSIRSVITCLFIILILQNIGAQDPHRLLTDNLFKLYDKNMEYKYLSDVYTYARGKYGVFGLTKSSLSMKPKDKKIVGGSKGKQSGDVSKGKAPRPHNAGVQKPKHYVNEGREIRLRKAPDVYNPADYIRTIVRRRYVRSAGPRILSPYNIRKKIVTDFGGTNTRAGDNIVLLRDSSTKLLSEYSDNYTSIASWYDKSHIENIDNGNKQDIVQGLLTIQGVVTRGITYSLTKDNSELLVLSKVTANTFDKTIKLEMQLRPDRPNISIILGPTAPPINGVDTFKCRPKVRNISMLMHFIQTGVQHPDAVVEGRVADINNIQTCLQNIFNEIDTVYGAGTEQAKYYKCGVELDRKRIGDHAQSEELRALLKMLYNPPADIAGPAATLIEALRGNHYGHITGDPCAAAASVLKGVSTVVSVQSKLETYCYRPTHLAIGGQKPIKNKIVFIEGTKEIPRLYDSDDYGDYDIYSEVALHNIKTTMLDSLDTLLQQLVSTPFPEPLVNMYFLTIKHILDDKITYTRTATEYDTDTLSMYISVPDGNYVISRLYSLMNDLIPRYIREVQGSDTYYNVLTSILEEVDSIMEYIAPYSYLCSFNRPDRRITYYTTLLQQRDQYQWFNINRFILSHTNTMTQIINDNPLPQENIEMGNDTPGGSKRYTKSTKNNIKHTTRGGMHPTSKVFIEESYQNKIKTLHKKNNKERKQLTDDLFEYQFRTILTKTKVLEQSSFINQIRNEYNLVSNLYKDAEITKTIQIDKQHPIDMLKYIFYIYSFYFPEFLDIFVFTSVVLCMDNKPHYIYSKGDTKIPTHTESIEVPKESIAVSSDKKPVEKDSMTHSKKELLRKIFAESMKQQRPPEPFISERFVPSETKPFNFNPSHMISVGGNKTQQKSKKEQTETITYKNQSYPLQYGSKGGAYILIFDKDTQKTKKKYILPTPDTSRVKKNTNEKKNK